MPNEDPVKRREYHRARQKQMASKGFCRCGKPRQPGRTRCVTCCANNAKHFSIRVEFRKRNGLCRLCGKTPLPGKTRCERCSRTAVRYLQRLKKEVIAAYGGACCCCGEVEHAFLTIDHINDDGNKHRKVIGTNRIYSWLKKNGFPKDDFRLLCFNCNCGRRVNGGVCPHQAKANRTGG